MKPLPVVYATVGVASLVFWLGAARAGWDPTAPAYPLPASVRHSPGGYRSFHFWHSGFHTGK